MRNFRKKSETVPKKAHKKCEAQKTNNTKPKTKTVDLLKMARETVTSVRSPLFALCSLLSPLLLPLPSRLKSSQSKNKTCARFSPCACESDSRLQRYKLKYPSNTLRVSRVFLRTDPPHLPLLHLLTLGCLRLCSFHVLSLRLVTSGFVKICFV